MKGLHKLTWILVIIGGLNWLLVGLFSWDISRFLGGMDSMIAKIIYILVGISALVELFSHKKNCKECQMSAPSMSSSNM